MCWKWVLRERATEAAVCGSLVSAWWWRARAKGCQDHLLQLSWCHLIRNQCIVFLVTWMARRVKFHVTKFDFRSFGRFDARYKGICCRWYRFTLLPCLLITSSSMISTTLTHSDREFLLKRVPLWRRIPKSRKSRNVVNKFLNNIVAEYWDLQGKDRVVSARSKEKIDFVSSMRQSSHQS